MGRVAAAQQSASQYGSYAARAVMAYVYILECADGSFYTGSTRHLGKRLRQHQQGEGARHTAKRLPVKLVYWEVWPHIGAAFEREKQIQGWSRKKKRSLIMGEFERLPELSACQNVSHSRYWRAGFDFAQPANTLDSAQPADTVQPEDPPVP